MSKVRTSVLILIACAVAAIAVYGIFFAMPARTVTWASSAGQQGGITNFLKDIFKKSDIALVVFGRPGVEYNGGGLADAILVVHFNPDTNKAHLISLPRDLWVSDDTDQFKINEVFIKNKIPAVMEKIEQVTGLDTNGYVIVDLRTLQDAVNYVGGVDVVLREPATDWVTGYTLPAGAHHLNGEDAVWLVRNRFNRQGDFFRESNQHLVVQALLEKFRLMDKDQKDAFLKQFVFKGSFLANAQIDFSKLTPYMFGTDLSAITFESIVLDFTTKLFTTTSLPIQGVGTTTYISTLIPTEGFEDYDAIREYIKTRMQD